MLDQLDNHMKKWIFSPILCCVRMTSRQIIVLKVKDRIVNLLEENIRGYLYDLVVNM